MDRQMLKQLAGWLDPYRVTDGSKFRLARIDPADTGGLKSESKKQAARRLADGVRWLAVEQDKLYAQDRWSLLLVFQAMDAAGKDGTIKHVMSGVNPQGCQVVRVQAAVAPRSSTTTSCGAAASACRSAAGSASSTARTTRRCWSCASIRRSSSAQQLPPGAIDEEDLAASATRTSRDFERLPAPQRHDGPEVLPARVEGRAEAAVPRADRRAGQELEVRRRRRRGARATGTTTWRPTRTRSARRHAGRAVVRGAGRQQVVHAAGRRGRGRRGAGEDGTRLSGRSRRRSGRNWRARARRCSPVERQTPPMQTYFISRYSSMPYLEPSRPMPDCLTPPNGATSVEMMPVLTPTMPYSSASATRQTRPTSRA